MSDLLSSHSTSLSSFPFPHLVIDNFLPIERARKIQQDILNLPSNEFDRYSNPFETKNTLRNKSHFPESVQDLFKELTSISFLKQLSELVRVNIVNDEHKHYWGIHTYEKGDKLEIHVDAGIHPQTGYKKYLTLGIYLSHNWEEDHGGELEFWSGDSAECEDPKIEKCIVSIPPIFNRMILFVCDDFAWHGNPNPTKSQDSKRIFVTLSYLTKDTNLKRCNNQRKRAYFASKRSENEDELKLLRNKRASDQDCDQVYRYS